MRGGMSGTPVNDPFGSRIVKSIKSWFLFSNSESNDPSFNTNFMGPGTPPPITIVVEEARTKDYDTGYNYTQHSLQGRQGVTIAQMRALADNCEILRGVIENGKNQMSTMGYDFHLKDIYDTTLTPDQYKAKSDNDPGIKKCREFFKKPDGRRRFKRWARMLLEEMDVTDFVCIYSDLSKLGNPLYSRLIDCATIVKKIDNTGETPFPPSIAYQQLIKGVVTKDFTTDDLIVFHRNPRVHSYWGFSKVEMVIHIVNIALRRSSFQLSYYTEGNIPDMLLRVTEKWSDEQIAKYQKYFDLLMSGDVGNRRKIRFVPDGVGLPIFAQAEHLKDEFDEWIARVICYVFSVTPNGFIKGINRATAEQQREQADEEGREHRLGDIKEVVDSIIEDWLKIENVELVWVEHKTQDSKKQAEIDEIDVKNGIRSRDEVRISRGLPPAGIGLTVTTQHGVVSLINGEEDHIEISKTDIDSEKNNPNFKDYSDTGA